MIKNYDAIRFSTDVFPNFQEAKNRIDNAYIKFKNIFPDECDELFDLFFNYQNRDVRYYPADSIKFVDSLSVNMVESYYYGNRTVGNVPYILILNEIVKFLKQHNYTLQDRNSFVTRILDLKYENAFLPYVILFFIIRNKYSLFKPILLVEDGTIQLIFEADYRYSFSELFISSKLSKEPAYKLLVSELKIVSESSIKDAISRCNERRDLDFNIYNNLTVFSYEIYHSNSRNFEERIVKYLERMGPTSRKDLAVYFEVSDRKMAYALSDLLYKGKIIKSTESKYSPHTMYSANNYYVDDGEDALLLKNIVAKMNHKKL